MPRIGVTLDFARTELLRPGWAKTYPSSALRPCRLRTEFEPGELPEDFWREPNSGVLMLRPSVARLDWKEDATFQAARIALADGSAASQMRELPATRTMTLALGGPSTPFTPVVRAEPWASANTEFAGSLGGWAFVTSSPLTQNEGWAAEFWPYGRFTDRAQHFAMFSFGGRFLLIVTLAGRAVLAYNRGTDASPVWRRVWSASYSETDPGSSRPYTVAVLPWGRSALTVLVSQSPGFTGGKLRSGFAREGETAFLVDLERLGIECPWDSATNQHVKYGPGHLGVAFKLSGQKYRLGLHKIRYRNTSQSEAFFGPDTVGPVPLDSGAPDVRWFGYADYVDFDTTVAGTKPKVDAAVVNIDGTAWDPAADTRPVLRVRMRPSSNGVLTPEVWAVNVEAREKTHTPSWTSVDRSADWVSVEFSQGLREPGKATLKLRKGAVAQMYRRGGPVRVTVDASPVFDGYCEQRLVTPQGHPGQARGMAQEAYEELLCTDMWTTMDVPVGAAVATDGLTLGEYLTFLLRRTGRPDAEIDIAAEIMDVPLTGFESTDAVSAPNPDTLVREIVEDLMKHYGIQGRSPLAVYWSAGAWRCRLLSLAPDPSRTFPAVIVDLTGDIGALLGRNTDAERWALSGSPSFRVLRALGNLEPTSRRPEFNAFEVQASTGTGDGADKAVLTVSPHPDVFDSTKYRFEGVARWGRVSAPRLSEIGEAPAARIVRMLAQMVDREALPVQLRAEWQPFMTVGVELMLAGRNDAGSPVSYGAWRVEHLAAECRHDWGSGSDHEWSSVYTLSWLGDTSHPSIPMFSGPKPPSWESL